MVKIYIKKKKKKKKNNNNKKYIYEVFQKLF